MKTTYDLFLHELKDIYFAEKQLVPALQTLADQATTAELQQLFLQHKAETEGQISRLENVFGILGQEIDVEPCYGVIGLIQEKEALDDEKPSQVVQTLANVASAQKVERYEITAYENLIKLGGVLELRESCDLLKLNLEEEYKALQNLEQLSEQYLDASFINALANQKEGVQA